jgi:tetratricopeptide (TPR) repeat protein
MCLLNLGVLHESLSEFNISENYYQKCLNDNISCRFNSARLCFNSGDYEKTIKLLEQTATTKLMTNFFLTYSQREKSSFYNLLSMAFLRAKKYNSANLWVERSLRENPSHSPAKSTKQFLRNISKTIN